MPSFLTKVFGRKKDEKDNASPPTTNKRLSQPSLLEGKYEAVSPSVSPSATHFPDAPPPPLAPVKESSLALLRSRSRTLDKQQPGNASFTPAPHLTLNLPVPKEEKSRALGVVFEADPDSGILLADKAIGERRLGPLEALLLVKACSNAIAERGGLESLGLMHPQWYSASPEIQRKLISLFVLSLGPKSPITTLSPTPTSPSAIFETELNYARDPHDIASVLRWGVRHLRLEGSSFGKDASSFEWSWYRSFATSERDANYPPRAFSQSLVPLLPPAHLQLLTALLDIMSSLAAHGEAIGTSGSKLSKLFGLWLVSAERVKASESWVEFYQRWEQAGRIFEHLFLAYIREEDSVRRMPLRLSELVKQYPYEHEKGSAGSKDDGLPFLSVPRFSTRHRDALVLRLDTRLPTPTSPRPSREHPLRLISEALKASVAADAAITGDVGAIWEDVKAKASETDAPDGAYPALSKILDDETLRLLSMAPAGQGFSPLPSPTPRSATTSSPATPMLRVPESPPRTRAASVGNPTGDDKTNGHSGAAPSLTNWADFSTTGFGDSSIGKDLSLTLADADLEKTEASRPSSRRPSPPRGRSVTLDVPVPKAVAQSDSASESKPKSTLKGVELVQIDEAFFDFWSDALLDPISSDWPFFVVCQLKDSTSKASLLVIEQTFSRPAPPLPPPTPTIDRREASPRPSMSASVAGRKSFTFSPTIKRFSLFNRAEPAGAGAKKTHTKSPTKSPRIGEMGEMVPEEEESLVARAPPAALAPSGPAAQHVQGLGLTTAKPSASAVPTAPAPPTKAEAELPAVPLVEAEPPEVPAGVAPVATEAVKTGSETPEKPTVSVPENPGEVSVPADAGAPAAEGGADEKVLPPAPEPVVLAGGTPGPEVALSSSEPAAIAQAAETAQAESEDAEAAEPEPQAPVAREPAAAQGEVAAEEQNVEGPTGAEPEEPQGTGQPAVVSAFTEHLDNSKELQSLESQTARPEPNVEEGNAAGASAGVPEPIAEPAAVEAASAIAEEAGAPAEIGEHTELVSETAIHGAAPDASEPEVAVEASEAADDSRDSHPSHAEEASI